MMNRLGEVYYDPSSPYSFATVNKLFQGVRKYGISKQETKDWLDQQLTHSLHQPARRNFPRTRYFVKSIGELCQADLVDLSMFGSQNDNFKHLLTFIDVFSKKAFVQPLKTKQAPEVRQAFVNIFREFKPQSLQTDLGGEFKNKVIEKFMNECKINHFFSKDKKIKCAVVERFNKSLKTKMFKYFTAKGTRRYIDKLEDFVNSYNDTKHSVIKMTPNQVSSLNSDSVFMNTYGYISPREYVRSVYNKKIMDRSLEKGDLVRTAYYVSNMDKGYFPNWTDQVFTIDSIIKDGGRLLYTIKDYKGNKQPRRYYSEEVQKIDKDPLFRIESILDPRDYNQRRRKGYSYVKWLNYPDSYNSWVKDTDIEDVG